MFKVLFHCPGFLCQFLQAKREINKEKFFPVLSFIQSQVADIDTSLYSIRKLVYVDSLRTDTIVYSS